MSAVLSFLFGIRLFPLILAPRGKAAADVPLRLVEIQQCAHLAVKPGVHTRQPLGEVLVYGGLADAEFFGGGADGRLILDDVHGQIAGPLL